jgi:hypothetical protein
MFNLLLRGSNKLFWLDVENSTMTFRPIFKVSHFFLLLTYPQYILNSVLLSTEYWKRNPLCEFILDFFALVSKFYFFYYPNLKVEKLQVFGVSLVSSQPVLFKHNKIGV